MFQPAEIGVLGWYGKRPIADFLGLPDKRIPTELDWRDVTTWFLRETPDYYVQHVPIWDLEAPSAAAPQFGKAYEPMFEKADVYWGQLRVYRRMLTGKRPASHTPTIAGRVIEAIADTGVQLNAEDKRIPSHVLVDFVASSDRQNNLGSFYPNQDPENPQYRLRSRDLAAPRNI